MSFSTHRFLFLILFSTGSIFLYGQSNLLKGRILDAVTQEPIPGANIFDPIGQTGTSTDRKGNFTFRVDRWPVRLAITNVGYEKFSLSLYEQPDEEITIFLVPEVSELPEAVIRVPRTDEEVSAPREQVLDFEFYQGMLLTVVSNLDTREERLELSTPGGEVIDASPLNLTGDKSLHVSCLGSAHLISGQDVYQLVIDEDAILGHQLSGNYHTYFWEVEKCVCANDDQVIYKLDGYLGQMIEYRLFRRDRDSTYVFSRVFDQDQIRLFYEEMVPKLALDASTADMTADHPDDLREIRNIQENLDGWKHFYYQPLYCPIFQTKDSLILFDHTASRLTFFSQEGRSLGDMAIRYHQEKNWGKQILGDEVSGRFYTTFKMKNGINLAEIHLSDGSLGDPVFLDSQTVDKLMIRDGMVYYLEKSNDPVFGFKIMNLKKRKLDDR